jgi:uncharacterized protein YyaL (SSP411 family)
VEVITDVGEEIDMAVTVSMADVSIGRVGGKFELGLTKRILHAFSRAMSITTKNNEINCFLNRMATSILNKKDARKRPLRDKKIIALKKQA